MTSKMTRIVAVFIMNDNSLSVVRPAMASEALQLLKEGKEIEIHNETVFELMRYFEKAERNLKLRFQFNRDNDGWTIVVPNCW